MKLLSLAIPLLLPTHAIAKAILGVDLGSLYMKVALVQRGSPLEIVTNLHSKRKTEQMVLFDAGTRFYGADANSLIARKPTRTPQSMSAFLGRGEDHPSVQVYSERHYPITPVYNSTRSGVCLTVDGNPFTPEELVAMVLSHAKDITAAYGVEGTITDCVLTVPSFYTQHERSALLDAAQLADLNVLALIDENTAAGLHYGIDRIEEEPQNILFYNMGASALQVSVMQFHSYEKKEKYQKPRKVGSFQVLGKAWDASLGGLAFDARIVDFMADEFNQQWNAKRNDGETKDVRKYARPMAKLRIQANKVKHVLSANNDFPIFIDSLYDDTNYQSHLSRSKFEEICHDLLERSTVPIQTALKAANMTLDDIHGVELIGGGMRVPKVQEEIQASLGGKLELGMHINSDESMALGAAFHGANVSTAFKVRHVGMTDINPFPIAVSLEDLDKEAAASEDEEVWSKEATIFKMNGKVGVKKTIAFTHDQEIACSLDYVQGESIPEGTSPSIQKYNVTGIVAFAKEMEEKGLSKPKISLQFELSSSGIVKLIKAEGAVEETYTVKEEVEVDDDEEEEGKDSKESEESNDAEGEKKEEGEGEATEEKADTEAKEEAPEAAEEKKEEDGATDGEKEEEKQAESSEGDEKKEEPEKKVKKKKKITVEKEKKKTHKRTLTVSSYHVGTIQPYSDVIMAESKAKLSELARLDKERMMLEEVRNNYESYIYHIKNKLIDDEEAIGAVTTQEQRDELQKSAEDAEEWMYDDGYDASLETYKNKYAELTEPAEKVFFRVKEVSARVEAMSALKEKLDKVVALMKKWETTMPQVTEDERNAVIEKVEDVRKWISEKEEAQAANDPTTDPVFTSEEVPLQTKDIQAVVSKLSRRPKPAPKKEKKEEKKNETDSSEDKKEDEKEPESDDKKEASSEEKESTESTETEESSSEGKEEKEEESKTDEETKDTATEDEL
mmetsp:Transcript_23165/g.34484  ORF Transcript_23165/g.34484 Transcript_23165/m.34484 type:complete len:958 (-) Transcript_23165:52-2925(-)|eukprot:CAMPEP_0203670798 /NCGR_PEP_ID=MMETSP0090-20130426/6771_1 /ASSEMBLY_ACC=CAM_ASM_001088 /TAXON_ID=426623 /ORGANISM="Chaetoceros affinis, Strain CCMP159" /LENGTH=957 /DNA_ID=CAMNT_0050535741 /DNA_START=272 /DNA_END=3145 /DNA_ORIENTATION=+